MQLVFLFLQLDLNILFLVVIDLIIPSVNHGLALNFMFVRETFTRKTKHLI